jgi:hypothetical protein
MRRLALLIALAFAALTLAPAAQANYYGKALIGCPAVQNADGTQVVRQDDSIVAPGVPGGADHPHTFQGNKYAAVDASRMTSSNMSTAGTTCFDPDDESGIWAPVFVTNGVYYGASMSYYVAANGANPDGIANRRIQMYPPGFAAIFHKGDPGVTVRWRCGNEPNGVYTSPPTTANCTASTFSMEIDTPNICWDGEHLDSADHRSHFRNNLAGGSCPADFYIRLPQQQAGFKYARAAMGGRLSSDHDPTLPAGYSAHYDYKALWEQNGGNQLVRCLSDPNRNTATAPLCGVFTYDGIPNANPWNTYIRKWKDVAGYVKSDGSASYISPPTIP